MKKDRKIRVLVAKPGIDSHYRGAELLCRALRDAGMEVIYTGRYQTSEMIVNTAIAEDVDVVALSYLGWSPKAYFIEVARMLKERGAGDICVVGGGIIPEADKPEILAAGVTGLYGPGTPLQEIIDHIVERVKKERWREQDSKLAAKN
jgi:methylmalonyl-CoA mutase C-terminal domain/subunit